MARQQTDPPLRPLEELLAEANEEAMRAKEPPQTPQIDATDIEAVRAMTWKKLVQIAAAMPSNDKALPILREIMDRLDGKPRQQIDTTLQGNITNTIQIVRFSDGQIIDQLQPDGAKVISGPVDK